MLYRTPGVYVNELSAVPPSVTEVETALPAFVGYTEKAQDQGVSLRLQPRRIRSLSEYEHLFGGPARPAKLAMTLDGNYRPTRVTVAHHYQLYYSLQLFFANGGGDCYIVSAGDYAAAGTLSKTALLAGINALSKFDQPTLLLFPDAALMGTSDLTDLQQQALDQCHQRQDRFGVFDLDETHGHSAGVAALRNGIGGSGLKFGAAYTPHLHTTLRLRFNYQDIELVDGHGSALSLATISATAGHDPGPATAIEKAVSGAASQREIDALALQLERKNPLYAAIVAAIDDAGIILPPSGALVGVYARVDNDRGVWKAPANAQLNAVKGLTVTIDNKDQGALTIDAATGKSINAIRAFAGRGIRVWGARTLDGNDAEWRYIPVRRFVNMVEESIKKSTAWARSEPNASNLWLQLASMIENYLTQKWRQGALAGTKPEEAFHVRVGLGKSMTARDIADGRLIIMIGLAVLRPAEFIIVKVCHEVQPS